MRAILTIAFCLSIAALLWVGATGGSGSSQSALIASCAVALTWFLLEAYKHHLRSVMPWLALLAAAVLAWESKLIDLHPLLSFTHSALFGSLLILAVVCIGLTMMRPFCRVAGNPTKPGRRRSRSHQGDQSYNEERWKRAGTNRLSGAGAPTFSSSRDKARSRSSP